MTTHSDLSKTIREAQARVRQLAETAPYIFPEYSALKAAEEEYELAKQKLVNARIVWERISGK